jgi:5-methylcytosine-specific restriction endonuclease McrA
MSKNIPLYLRKAAILRAKNCCEYCQVADLDSYYGFQVDHIISRKHGGKTLLYNLAYCCPDCNRYKGTDLGTYIDDSLNLIRLFHPRLDIWNDHFETDNSGFISPLTDIGTATVKVLSLNHADRIIERRLLWQLGLLN